MAEESNYRNLDARLCPVLDTPLRTLSALELGYAFPATTTAPAWDDLGIVEVDAWVRCLYLENEAGGDLDLRLFVNSMTLQGYSGTDSGYALIMAGASARWSQRFVNGYGLQIDTYPGIYSALEAIGGGSFNAPSGARLIKAFSPTFAVYAGAMVYPSFKHAVDPTAGLLWSRRDAFILELAYPASRLILAPSPSFRFFAGASARLWPEYDMEDDDAREILRYEEQRVTGGIEWGVTDFTELLIEGGYVLNRTISFEAASPDVDLDDAPFARIGIRGRL